MSEDNHMSAPCPASHELSRVTRPRRALVLRPPADLVRRPPAGLQPPSETATRAAPRTADNAAAERSRWGRAFHHREAV